MPLPRKRPLMAALALALALSIANCSDEGSGNNGVFTPEDMEDALEGSFGNIPKIGDALERIILTLQGTPQPGVTVTPITDGVQGSVGIDLDGNGSMETTVNGSLIFFDPNVGIDAGATAYITGITGANIDGELQVAITPLSPTDFNFGPGFGSFEGENIEFNVPQIAVTADVSGAAPVLDGFATFAVESEPGTMFFEDDQQGGFQLRVVFGGDEFTVP